MTHNTEAANDAADGAKAGRLLVTPRALAGPGLPEIVLKALDSADWQRHHDDLGQEHAWSPDRHLYVGFVPESGLDQAWLVKAYRDTGSDQANAAVWSATFSSLVPAELVTAFIAAVTHPAGIARDPSEPGTLLPPPVAAD